MVGWEIQQAAKLKMLFPFLEGILFLLRYFLSFLCRSMIEHGMTIAQNSPPILQVSAAIGWRLQYLEQGQG